MVEGCSIWMAEIKVPFIPVLIFASFPSVFQVVSVFGSIRVIFSQFFQN